MKTVRRLNTHGFILIEVILSITLLGIVVVPLMSVFVMSAKINQESSKEYKALLQAQENMEEIKANDVIDFNDFVYKSELGYYEKTVEQTEERFGTIVKIIPKNNLISSIEVSIIHNGEVVNTLIGSKIIN